MVSIACTAAWAQTSEVDFEKVVLPTDLVAEVVQEEDGIDLDAPDLTLGSIPTTESDDTTKSPQVNDGNVFALVGTTPPESGDSFAASGSNSGNAFSEVASAATYDDEEILPLAQAAPEEEGLIDESATLKVIGNIEPTGDSKDNVFSEVASATFHNREEITTMEKTATEEDDLIDEPAILAISGTAESMESEEGNIFSEVVSVTDSGDGEIIQLHVETDKMTDTSMAAERQESRAQSPPLGLAMSGPALLIPSPDYPIESIPPTVPAAPMDPDRINEDEVILGWANAWSDNDIETYLSYYADRFQPPQQGQSRDEWEALRRSRLQNQNIRIIVSNASVHEIRGDVVEVRFTQRYTSRSYKDRVIKSIEMIRTDAGWRFISEQEIEKLPFQ